MINYVIKSDGTKEEFNPNKLNIWAEFASDHKVNWSDISLKAYRKCFDGCTTKDLHKAMIDACVEKEDHNHLQMAGRLLIGDIYKEVFGGFKGILSLHDFYEGMVSSGYWASMEYTEDELTELDVCLDHSKDLTYNYTSLRQLKDKYLVQDRVKKRLLETPQFMFMGMAMQNMEKQPKERRVTDVIQLYTYLSDMKINAPTPMLVNMRTNHKGYASCCVYTTDDTAASLAASDHISYMMTCASAGIGGYIKTRSKGDSVRGGTISHLGKLPYLRMNQAAVHANLQSCYSDDTEILTDSGFVLFKDLKEEQMVAQVHNGGKVSFMKPLRIIEDDYSGEMYRYKTGRNMGIDLMVTPNHRMAWRKSTKVGSEATADRYVSEGWDHYAKNYVVSPNYEFTEAEFFNPSREHVIDFGGKAFGNNKELTFNDRLNIAFQADGVSKPAGNFAYTFRFTKESKIERLKWILDNLDIEYTVSLQKTGVTSFYVKVGRELSKDFSQYGLSCRDSNWFKDFVREVSLWDGSTSVDSSMDAMTYCNTNEKAVDFVQAAAVLCGAYCHKKTTPASGNISETYNLYVSFDKNLTTGRAIERSKYNYNGRVYCVEVATGAVIVRRNGKTAVCGNSRGGASTQYFNVLDPEVKDLLALKNPTTVVQKQIKDIDYALVVNKFFARKVALGEDWMIISYGEAPDLHEAMYSGDISSFERLYEHYYHSNHKKEFVKARDIAVQALTEAVETGRIYMFWADEANKHTPFKDKIYSSNL